MSQSCVPHTYPRAKSVWLPFPNWNNKYEFVKDLPRMKQRNFEIACHLKTWNMAKLPLEPAFAFLQETGFRAFGALVADTLMFDFSRRPLH